MSRRIKPADEADDGSSGAWINGLPVHVAGRQAPTRLDYDAQGGAPRALTGGSYSPNVTGAPPPPAAPAPVPFKLSK